MKLVHKVFRWQNDLPNESQFMLSKNLIISSSFGLQPHQSSTCSHLSIQAGKRRQTAVQ